MRKFLFFLGLLTAAVSCEGQKNTGMKSQSVCETKIILSGTQGGTGKSCYKILRSTEALRSEANRRNTVIIAEASSEQTQIALPGSCMAVVCDLGSYSSGDHSVSKILGTQKKGNVLEVFIPKKKIPGPLDMEIQVLSRPWMIFTVPADDSVTEIKLTQK